MQQPKRPHYALRTMETIPWTTWTSPVPQHASHMDSPRWPGDHQETTDGGDATSQFFCDFSTVSTSRTIADEWHTTVLIDLAEPLVVRHPWFWFEVMSVTRVLGNSYIELCWIVMALSDLAECLSLLYLMAWRNQTQTKTKHIVTNMHVWEMLKIT